jgi:hypothetical protein
MFKTSRKSESAFSRRGRDIINSRRVNRRVNQEGQLSIKQNELDREQLHLIEDLANNIIENGDQHKFLKYKQPLSEEEIEEIYELLPKRHLPSSMNRHLKNPLFLSVLLITVLANIVNSAEAYRIFNQEELMDCDNISRWDWKDCKNCGTRDDRHNAHKLECKAKGTYLLTIDTRRELSQLQSQMALLVQQNQEMLQIIQKLTKS